MKRVQPGVVIPDEIIAKYNLPSRFENSRITGYEYDEITESWVFSINNGQHRFSVDNPLVSDWLISKLETQLRSEIGEKERIKRVSKNRFSLVLIISSFSSALAFALSDPLAVLAAEGYTAEFGGLPPEQIGVIAGLCYALFALTSTFVLVRWTLFDLISSTHALR